MLFASTPFQIAKQRVCADLVSRIPRHSPQVANTGLFLCDNDEQRRFKHSSRQVNRLFRKHPARLRVEQRMGISREPVEPVGDINYPPIFEPKMLPNGWSAPPGQDVAVPVYPFQVSRTKNKPNGGIGFLPVYSEYRKDGGKVTTRIRKVTGDNDAFLAELRAVLNLPKSKYSRDEPIRIRTGGTVEVKGNRVLEVKEWLGGLGF